MARTHEYELEFVDTTTLRLREDGSDYGTFTLSKNGLVHAVMIALSWYVESTPEAHCDGRLVRMLGRCLFEFAFTSEEDRPERAEARGRVRDRCADRCHGLEPVRITLSFKDAARSYAQLPWEFLVIPTANEQPATGHHLAQLENVAVTLTRQAIWGRTVSRADGPLRVLLVTYSPIRMPEIATEELEDQLRALQKDGLVELEVLYQDEADWASISATIGKFRPHVFHFSGHGERNALWLAGAAERPRVLDNVEKSRQPLGYANVADLESLRTSVSGVVRLFDEHQPELAILNACDTDWSWLAEVLPTVAHQVSEKVPAVVAMRYPISNRAAEQFSIALYPAILEGRPIDEAVQLARRSLFPKGESEGSRAFGTPVLYQNGSKEICAPVSRAAEDSASTHRIPAPARDCPRCGSTAVWTENAVQCTHCEVWFQCRNPECTSSGRTVYTADQIRVLRICPSGCGSRYDDVPPVPTSTPRPTAPDRDPAPPPTPDASALRPATPAPSTSTALESTGVRPPFTRPPDPEPPAHGAPPPLWGSP